MYQLPELSLIPGLVHGFSEVGDGNMDFRFGAWDAVAMDRAKFLAALGAASDRCVWMSVQHGTAVVAANTNFAGRGAGDEGSAVKADALVTNKRGIFLAVLTADCLPVILYDPKKSALALVHASRKNTPLGIVGAVVARMQKAYGTAPADLIAGIGPAIHKDSYIFNVPELQKGFADESEWKDFLVETHPGEVAVDLIGYNLWQLIDARVPEHRVEVCDSDTAVDTRFFSYVRSRRTGESEGRMATAVGMI